jgi:RNA polymerase II subunit A C-terminal domain phosphatase SSU72
MKVESYGTGTQVRLPGKSAMEPRIFKFGTPYAEMYRSLSATPEDEAFFVHNGVLQLCKRGASVKVRLFTVDDVFSVNVWCAMLILYIISFDPTQLAPQRWQDTPSEDIQKHDVVIAFEERIYDAVVEDLQAREPTEDFKALHVICLDTKVRGETVAVWGRCFFGISNLHSLLYQRMQDNPHEAQLQGRVALELCWLLERTADLDVEAPELIERFQEQQMTHTQIKVLHQICYL